MKRWEYKTIALATTGLMGGKIDPVQLDKVLNPLGEAGWEIAAGFDTNQAYGQSRDVVIILRREKP
jgi:hypothetical protein